MNSSLLYYFTFITLKEMVNLFPEEMDGRDGGYITMLRVGDPNFSLSVHAQIGIYDITKDMLELFKVGSMEKARRLHQTVSKRKHISSYQSRDPEENKYGGAILAKEGWIVSFSGVTEKVDELISVAVAFRLKIMDVERMDEILTISGNSLPDYSVLA